MKDGKVTCDEFGILSFTIDVKGTSYKFDKNVKTPLIFVTTVDSSGKVVAKTVIDTKKQHNKKEVEYFEMYVLENYIDEDKRK